MIDSDNFYKGPGLLRFLIRAREAYNEAEVPKYNPFEQARIALFAQGRLQHFNDRARLPDNEFARLEILMRTGDADEISAWVTRFVASPLNSRSRREGMT